MKRLLLPLLLGLSLTWLVLKPLRVEAAPASSLCAPLPYGYGLMPWTITTNGWASHPWFSNVTTNTEQNITSGDLSAGANGHADIFLSDWQSPTLYPGALGYLIVVQITADADADRFNVAADQVPSKDFDFDLSNSGVYSVAAGRIGAATVLSTYVSLWDESNQSVNENPNQADQFDFTWYWTGPGNIDATFTAQFWVIVDSPQACPSPALMPLSPNCTITATQTIQTGPLVTETAEVTTTYTVSSNLISNYSFEQGTGLSPDNWTPTRDGVTLPTTPPFWDYNVDIARSYYRSIYNADDFILQQLLPIHSSGTFLAGFYSRCVGDCSQESVSLYWSDHYIASTSNLSTTYQVFSDTYSVGYGSPWYRLALDEEDGGNIHVDDAFVYPVDDSGALVCTSAYYPPPDVDPEFNEDCVIDPVTGACLVVPSGAGSACYYCGMPGSGDYLYVSYWIAWLGCLLNNLFHCHLDVWLQVVGNWTNGVVQLLFGLLAWLPATFSGLADWIMTEVMPALVYGIGSITQQTGTTIWDVLLALLQIVSGLLGLISNLLLGVFDLVIAAVNAIRQGFAVDPYVLSFGDSGISEPISGNLSAAGINDSKILYLFILGAGLIDNLVFANQFVGQLLLVILGAVAIGVTFWTFHHWRGFVRF